MNGGMSAIGTKRTSKQKCPLMTQSGHADYPNRRTSLLTVTRSDRARLCYYE